jgi:hypothetical protein
MRYCLRIVAVGLALNILISSAGASASRYRWRKSSITVAVSSSVTSNISNIAANADVTGAIDRSIAAWQQAAAISIRRTSSNDQNVSPSVQGDGVSLLTIAATPENVALFPQGLDDATARTRIFYDARGSITEADIVLNPYLQFSTDGTPGTFDLESTLTHELGHLLGLEHSPVIGATMSDSYGRNGVYNLPAFSARTLASDDIAAIRSIYGPAEPEEGCCGRINGRFLTGATKFSGSYTVWAEDSEDGRVLGAARTSADGSFHLGGLPSGKVDLYAQSESDDSSPALELGQVTVNANQPVNLARRLERPTGGARFDYLGLNGQLAVIAVPVNAGNSYFLLAGSTDISEGTSVESDSRLISISPRSTPGIFSRDIKTLGFEAAISPEAPVGEYSISLRSATGNRRFLIGGITVERFPNFWTTGSIK